MADRYDRKKDDIFAIAWMLFLILAGAKAALDRQNEASKAASEVQRIKPDLTLKKYVETLRYIDPKKTGTGNEYSPDGRIALGECKVDV